MWLIVPFVADTMPVLQKEITIDNVVKLFTDIEHALPPPFLHFAKGERTICDVSIATERVIEIHYTTIVDLISYIELQMFHLYKSKNLAKIQKKATTTTPKAFFIMDNCKKSAIFQPLVKNAKISFLTFAIYNN